MPDGGPNATLGWPVPRQQWVESGRTWVFALPYSSGRLRDLGTVIAEETETTLPLTQLADFEGDIAAIRKARIELGNASNVPTMALE